MPESKITKLKETVVSIREILIISVLVAFFIFPSSIKGIFEELGFTEIDFFGLKAKIENEADLREASQIEDMEKQLSVFQAKVDSLTKGIENCTTSPVVKELVADLNSELSDSKNSMVKRSNLLKSKIVVQQEVIKQRSNTIIPISGWLYVGAISEDKINWESGSPKNIDAQSPLFDEGEILMLKQDAYLRNEGEKLKQSNADIKAVVPSGTKLKFKEIEYSHAKNGGWFGWIRVIEITDGG